MENNRNTPYSAVDSSEIYAVKELMQIEGSNGGDSIEADYALHMRL